jgi:hypothetical protein
VAAWPLWIDHDPIAWPNIRHHLADSHDISSHLVPKHNRRSAEGVGAMEGMYL